MNDDLKIVEHVFFAAALFMSFVVGVRVGFVNSLLVVVLVFCLSMALSAYYLGKG